MGVLIWTGASLGTRLSSPPSPSSEVRSVRNSHDTRCQVQPSSLTRPPLRSHRQRPQFIGTNRSSQLRWTKPIYQRTSTALISADPVRGPVARVRCLLLKIRRALAALVVVTTIISLPFGRLELSGRIGAFTLAILAMFDDCCWPELYPSTRRLVRTHYRTKSFAFMTFALMIGLPDILINWFEHHILQTGPSFVVALMCAFGAYGYHRAASRERERERRAEHRASGGDSADSEGSRRTRGDGESQHLSRPRIDLVGSDIASGGGMTSPSASPARQTPVVKNSPLADPAMTEVDIARPPYPLVQHSDAMHHPVTTRAAPSSQD